MTNEHPPQPNSYEQPEAAYAAAYAERYGLALPEDVEPSVPAVENQEDSQAEHHDAYARLLRAIEGAQRSLGQADSGAEKLTATLRLEDMQQQLADFVQLRGAPDQPPTFTDEAVEEAPKKVTDTHIERFSPERLARVMSLSEFIDWQKELFTAPKSPDRDVELAYVNERILALSKEQETP